MPKGVLALLLRIAADRHLRDPEDILTLAGLRTSFSILGRRYDRARRFDGAPRSIPPTPH